MLCNDFLHIVKVLDKNNANFDRKKVQGYDLLRQEFQGLLVVKETLAAYFIFY